MTHYTIIDKDNNVRGFGANTFGQLGLVPNSRTRPTKIEGLPLILSTSTGNGHTLFLDFEGNVWISGRLGTHHNKYILTQEFQLKIFVVGLGDYNYRDTPTKIENLYDIKSVSAGGTHTIFMAVV